MTADIHQGEIIMDRQSSDALRKYGVPVKGSADSKELIVEVKRMGDAIVNMGKNIAAIKGHSDVVQTVMRLEQNK
jgi:hypothetical protein